MLDTQPLPNVASEPRPHEVEIKTVDTQPRYNVASEPCLGEVGVDIITADRDRGCWWLRSRSGRERVTTDEFIQDGRFDGYDMLVIEAAHLNPRTDPPKSKAQVYTAEQLAAWRPGCPVRTVKELHAAKRRALFEIEGKAEGDDAEALYRWVEQRIAALGFEKFRDSTRKFPFKPVPSWLVAIIEDMNVRQNTARVLDYADEESKRVLPFFEKREGSVLNPLRKPFSGTKFHVWREKKSKAAINPAYIMAAYTALFEADGTPRVDDRGRPISKTTVKRLMGMAGDAPRSVARGKIQHDLYAAGLGRLAGHARAMRAESPEFKEYRNACEAALLHLIALTRDIQPRYNVASEPCLREVGVTPACATQPHPNAASEPCPAEVGSAGIFTEEVAA